MSGRKANLIGMALGAVKRFTNRASRKFRHPKETADKKAEEEHIRNNMIVVPPTFYVKSVAVTNQGTAAATVSVLYENFRDKVEFKEDHIIEPGATWLFDKKELNLDAYWAVAPVKRISAVYSNGESSTLDPCVRGVVDQLDVTLEVDGKMTQAQVEGEGAVPGPVHTPVGSNPTVAGVDPGLEGDLVPGPITPGRSPDEGAKLPKGRARGAKLKHGLAKKEALEEQLDDLRMKGAARRRQPAL